MIYTTGLSAAPLEHVLRHLRRGDMEEIDAARGEFDPFFAATEFTRLTEGWLFWNAAKGPVAALGFSPISPACVSCWALGTDAWPVLDVTKHIRRVMVPQLLDAGFHRAECRALATRDDSRRWLESLGWKAEAVLSGFGIRREDFILFAWTAPYEQTHHLERLAGPDSLPVRGH